MAIIKYLIINDYRYSLRCDQNVICTIETARLRVRNSWRNIYREKNIIRYYYTRQYTHIEYINII